MKKDSLTSRDHILIITCLGVLLVVSFYSLLEHRSAHLEAISKGEDNLWGTFLFYVHTIIPFLIIGAFILWMIRIYPKSKLTNNSGTRAQLFQNPIILHSSLIGFSIGQLGCLLSSSRIRSTAELVATFFLLLIVIWLFYRRERPPTQALIFSSIWSIMLVDTRRTFARLIGILEDPSWLISLRIVWGVLLLLLVMYPWLRLISAKMKQKSLINLKQVKLPIGIYITYLLLLVGFILWDQSLDKQITQLWIVFKFFGLVGIVLLANLLQSIFSEKLNTQPPIPLKISDGQYRIGLFVVSLVYISLAIKTGENLPETINPDGLAYFTMARNYAEGNFVIRGAWPPLLPWLLAPFIHMGIDVVSAWRYIAGASGLLWTLSIVRFAGIFGLSKLGKLVLATSMALLSLRIAFVLITPDIISAIILIWYFYFLLHPKFKTKPLLVGIVVGLLGALTYYARFYNLYFVWIHLFLTAIIWLAQKRPPKNVIVGVGSALVGLVILISPFVAGMSARYGSFTLSTTSSINRSAFGPDSVSHPCRETIPCKIPDDVLFPREDPPLDVYPASDWNPFSDEKLLYFQVNTILQGLDKFSYFLLSSFGYFPFYALISLPMMILIYWCNQKKRFLFLWMTFTVSLYAFGYITFGGGVSRYHLPYIPLLFLIFYFILDNFSSRLDKISKKAKSTTTNFLYILIIGISVLTVGKIPEIISNLETSSATKCNFENLDILAGILTAPMVGSDMTIYDIAYQTRVQTYGVIKPDTDPIKANEYIETLNIKTFLAIKESPLEITLSEEYSYHEIGEWEICDVDYSILQPPEEDK